MIRLTRSPEPAALPAHRAAKLQAARSAVAAGQSPVLDGYDAHGEKETLFQDQRRKCAYCEKREEQAKYRPVEHYRPRSRYWWLTWTWENLLFACTDCNSDHKKAHFPLADEAARLRPEDAPPGHERPDLVDPFEPSLDPTQDIEFCRERVQGQERWRPVGRSRRGHATVKICGLDRPGLLDLYGNHVRKVVRPRVEYWRKVRDLGDAQAIVSAWSTLRRGLFAPEAEFQLLSRDALRALVSAEDRARYHLELPF